MILDELEGDEVHEEEEVVGQTGHEEASLSKDVYFFSRKSSFNCVHESVHNSDLKN